MSQPELPPSLQGVLLVIQHIVGNAHPSVTAISAGDTTTLKQIMSNVNVLEAEAYRVVGVQLVGTKTVAIAADGVFERASAR